MSRLNDGYPDRKYYNVVISNNEKRDDYTYAQYKDVSNQQIIADPSKYYLCVLRFQIPTADIPILIPEIEQWPNTDVNRTVYTISLTYTIGVTEYIATRNVIYVSTAPFSYVRPITANDPNPMVNPTDYYFIYNYRSFIDMVNTAFIDAYTDLDNQVGNTLNSAAPFITYNGNNYLMSLHARPEYLPTDGIKIYMNYKLYTFFDGIEYTFNSYAGPKAVEFLTKNYNNTNFDGTNYIMSQQYPSLSVWNVFKSIQIVSNMIPIENEIIPIPSIEGANTYNTSAVIKDFIPFYENGPEFRTFINYSVRGSYELIDLNSNVPIKTVDVTVYWLDRYGNKYLVSVPYNQILSIKFAFIRKDTFTG